MKWQELKNNPQIKNYYDLRIAIIRLIREFFWSLNFVEVDTPIAIRLPGQEPYLNPVPVIFHNAYSQVQQFYLQTSPEYAMKKLLGVGYKNIFQICKCFRDYENFGGNHNPEFSMIEWYRSPGELEEIMNDTENLFKFISQHLNIDVFKCKNSNIKIFDGWDKKTMKALWQEYLNVNLDEYLSLGQIKKLAIDVECELTEPGLYEDYFYKIFLNKIEPKLGLNKPIFVYDYPLQLCSLSCQSKDDSRYGQRFELYVGGLEIANAFGELVDGAEQNIRLQGDQMIRQQLGKNTWPVDSELISALDSGLDSASGIALGVDRLIMLLTGAKNINDVIFQAVDDEFNDNK